MKIGDKLLKLGYLNKKQLTEALKVQSQEKILYNKDLQLGKILLDKKFLTLDDVLLLDTDWTDLPNAPLTDAQKTNYQRYRNELRDVPQSAANPKSVVWPEL